MLSDHPHFSCTQCYAPFHIVKVKHTPLPQRSSLAGSRLRLWCGALGSLLADDTAGSLASSTLGGALGLLCLLHALSGVALLLGLLGCCVALGGTSLRAHGTALLDHIERSTNDGTLGLHLATATRLGLLLYMGLDYPWDLVGVHCGLDRAAYLSDTLPVRPTAEDSPCDTARVLALEEEGL